MVHLAQAVARIAAHPWPRSYIPKIDELLTGLSELTGAPLSDDDCEAVLAAVPGVRGFLEGSLQDTANPTMLNAGYKTNVIPQTAIATLDCRFLPGHQDELLATVRRLAGEHVEVMEDLAISLEAPFSGPVVESMIRALRHEDPQASVLPYCLSGGTDNKSLAELGITGYGFVRCAYPRSSHLHRCSMALTSAFRLRHWPSEPACWGAWSATARPPRGKGSDWGADGRAVERVTCMKTPGIARISCRCVPSRHGPWPKGVPGRLLPAPIRLSSRAAGGTVEPDGSCRRCDGWHVDLRR